MTASKAMNLPIKSVTVLRSTCTQLQRSAKP